VGSVTSSSVRVLDMSFALAVMVDSVLARTIVVNSPFYVALTLEGSCCSIGRGKTLEEVVALF
jgi:hypothetical protein